MLIRVRWESIRNNYDNSNEIATKDNTDDINSYTNYVIESNNNNNNGDIICENRD